MVPITDVPVNMVEPNFQQPTHLVNMLKAFGHCDHVKLFQPVVVSNEVQLLRYCT